MNLLLVSQFWELVQWPSWSTLTKHLKYLKHILIQMNLPSLPRPKDAGLFGRSARVLTTRAVHSPGAPPAVTPSTPMLPPQSPPRTLPRVWSWELRIVGMIQRSQKIDRFDDLTLKINICNFKQIHRVAALGGPGASDATTYSPQGTSGGPAGRWCGLETGWGFEVFRHFKSCFCIFCFSSESNKILGSLALSIASAGVWRTHTHTNTARHCNMFRATSMKGSGKWPQSGLAI